MSRVAGLRSVGLSPRGTSIVISAAVLGLCVWIVSPRFTIDGPSMVDDWSAIEPYPRHFGLAEFLDPSSRRYRPGWILWNDLQWHTLGAPASMFGPSLWGIVRLLVLIIGLAVAAALLLGIRSARRAGPDVVLIGLPSLAILAAPAIAIDVARFGPQEPLLVGGMALGGSLLYLGARDIARERAIRPMLTGAKIAVGYLLWTLGVYEKEVSVCVLLFLACAAFGERRAIVEMRRLERRRKLMLGALGVAVLLPLVHVAVEVVRIVEAGQLVYGASVQPSGAHETLTAIRQIPTVLHTHFGWLLLATAILGVAVSLARRRPDWLQIGLLLTAIAALAWSVQTDVLVSRYYMPTIALLALGSVRAVHMLSRWTRTVAVVVLLVSALASVATAHREVGSWASYDRTGVRLVHAVAGLEETGCPIALTGLDPERSESLPALVALRDPQKQTCRSKRAYVVAGNGVVPDGRILAACAGSRTIGTYEMGWWGGIVTIDRCHRLALGPAGRAAAQALLN